MGAVNSVSVQGFPHLAFGVVGPLME